MKKPVIVCDIDDVIFPFVTGIAAHYNSLKGAHLTPEDFFSYSFNEVWGGTQDEATVIIESFLSGDCLHLEPVEGAREALGRLKQDFSVVLVTARNGVVEESTGRWLKKHLPDLFADLIFAGNPFDGRGFRTKGEICKELGALLIIDDHPSHIASAAKQGIEGILFGKRAWTIADNLPTDLVKCCPGWPEIVDYIYNEWRSKQLSV